jgi:hypothetical protein
MGFNLWYHFIGRYVTIDSNISIDVAVSALRDVHQAFAQFWYIIHRVLSYLYIAAQQAVYEL